MIQEVQEAIGEKTYEEIWKSWEPKVATTARQWSLPGVIGCTYDDLYSTAQRVLLRSLKYYTPDKAKFSTFFYTNLHNAFKTEYSKSGLVRQGYKVRVTHKKLGSQTILDKVYSSSGEAHSVAEQIGRKRRRADVVSFEESRVKRIPPHQVTPFHAPAEDDVLNAGSDKVMAPEELIASSDTLKPNFSQIVLLVRKRITDRIDRKVLFRLYIGHSVKQVAEETGLSHGRLRLRLKRLRKIVDVIVKDLDL